MQSTKQKHSRNTQKDKMQMIDSYWEGQVESDPAANNDKKVSCHLESGLLGNSNYLMSSAAMVPMVAGGPQAGMSMALKFCLSYFLYKMYKNK